MVSALPSIRGAPIAVRPGERPTDSHSAPRVLVFDIDPLAFRGPDGVASGVCCTRREYVSLITSFGPVDLQQ
jgi:hypothetical protein